MDRPASVARELAQPRVTRAVIGIPIDLAAAAITLLGLALRLYRLNDRSFWVDEISQAHFTRFDTLEQVMAYTLAVPDVMPLTNIMSWSLRWLGHDEWAIRLPFAIASALSIYALYLLGKTLWGAATGLLAALLMALLPYQVWYGQEARPYAIVVLLTILQMLFAYRAIVTPQSSLLTPHSSLLTPRHLPFTFYALRFWLLFALVTVLNLYCHYIALGSTAVAYAFIALILSVELGRAIVRPGTGPGVREVVRKVGAALVATALVVLAYAPWLPYFRTFIGRSDLGFGTFSTTGYTPTWDEVMAFVATYDFSGLMLVFLGLGTVTVVISIMRGQWRGEALVLIWLGGPLLVFVEKLQGDIVHMWPRYLLFVLPAAILLTARGIDSLVAALVKVKAQSSYPSPVVGDLGVRRSFSLRMALHAVIAVLLMAQVLPALAQSYDLPKEDTRGAANYLVKNSPPDSIVIAMGLHGSSINWGLRYYFWRLGSPISYLKDTGLESRTLEMIEQSKGDIWGIAFDNDPVSHHVKSLSKEQVEIVLFPRLTLFRLKQSDVPPIEQVRELMNLILPAQPELQSTLDLLDAWTEETQPTTNLLPAPAVQNGWAIPDGVSVSDDGSSLVLTPTGPKIQATYAYDEVQPGERYLLSFECRNSMLTGFQLAYVAAMSRDAREVAIFPSRFGLICDGTLDWRRGMFAFIVPDGATSLIVRLAAEGSGSAEYRHVQLWQVK